MKIVKRLIIAAVMLTSCSVANASTTSTYACPAPSSVAAISVTPSGEYEAALWLAPNVPGAVGSGDGLGGNQVGAFVRVDQATVNGKPGWVCLYNTSHFMWKEIEKMIDQLPIPATVRDLIRRVMIHMGINDGFVAYQAK